MPLGSYSSGVRRIRMPLDVGRYRLKLDGSTYARSHERLFVCVDLKDLGVEGAQKKIKNKKRNVKFIHDTLHWTVLH